MKGEKLDIDWALDTPFYRNLIEASRFLMDDNFSNRKGYTQGKNNYHILTQGEKKISRTFRLLSCLSTTLLDIRMVYLFIKRFPSKDFLNKNDISELDYIKFHYEVFIHKVHTICEIMKLISNEVLDLKIPEKECNWASLIARKSFNKSKCKEVIDGYFKSFKNLIDDRHLNSHRGIFEDTKMDQIDPSYFIYRWYKKHDLDIQQVFKNGDPTIYFKYRISEFKREKLGEISENEQTIFKYVKEFLVSLKTLK